MMSCCKETVGWHFGVCSGGADADGQRAIHQQSFGMARCLSTWNSVDEGAVRVCNVTRPFRGGIGVCIAIPMIGAVGAHARQDARPQASCPSEAGPLGQPPSCDARNQGRPIEY